METVNHTVNQIVSVASNAIWGENGTQNSQSNVPHGEEPISGVQGKGIINDPYDAGNRDDQPEAPATDGNTAPQDPKLAGNSLSSGNTSTPAATGSNSSRATTGSHIAGLKHDSAIAIPSPIAEQRSLDDLASTTQDQGNTSAPTATSTSAAATSLSTPATNSPNLNSNSQVSKEALEGPQGPARYSAEQFERDEKLAKQQKNRSKAAKEEGDSSPTQHRRSDSWGNSSKSNSSKSEGNGNGKTSPMAKVKHTLHRVAHPRHNS